MATMTPQDQAATIKAAFELAELTERMRIESGIRDPHQWVTKRAVCSGRHAGAFCRGCYQQIEPGMAMVWEQDRACYITARKNRYWHPHCHPDWISREFERLRGLWTKKVTKTA